MTSVALAVGAAELPRALETQAGLADIKSVLSGGPTVAPPSTADLVAAEGVFLVAVAVEVGSAVYGYRAAARCEDARVESAQREASEAIKFVLATENSTRPRTPSAPTDEAPVQQSRRPVYRGLEEL
jgi:hypothetical protein